MKTFILLILVTNQNARKICEQIEGSKFFKDPAEIDELKNIEFEYHEITDFMDMVNNEEFNPGKFFMSYIVQSTPVTVWATCAEADNEIDAEDLEAIKASEYAFSETFDTQAEADAFVQGLAAADGWFGTPTWAFEQGKLF